jgi:hypothetical protein
VARRSVRASWVDYATGDVLVGWVPTPLGFSLDLCNQEVAGEAVLQNIDSRDFGYKLSGMNSLKGWAEKWKGCGRPQPLPISMYLL